MDGVQLGNAVAVTVAIFVLGIVFTAGRLSARVDALESWRAEVHGMLDSINRRLGVLTHQDKRDGDQ